MKIAVSAMDSSLDAEVSPHFAKSPYFLIVDPQTMEFDALDNSRGMTAGGGGIAAHIITGYEVEAVLTGECGPNVKDVLSQSGVSVITDVRGTVSEVSEAYMRN